MIALRRAVRVLAAWLLLSPGLAAAERAPDCPDPDWSPRLPAGWALAEVSGLAVDGADHLWILHRAPKSGPAPPVIELDTDGKVLRAWDGHGPGHDWPEEPHSIAVDREGRVWISGNGPRDGQILAFDQDGRFLRQIGRPTSGRPASNDTTRLGRPTGIAVDIEAHEVFVADGYANRRVIVFDSETGAYKRHWGAYGGRPDDRPGTARQFGLPVHCVRLGPGGLVYVCDRRNDRAQMFRRDGGFVAEWQVAPGTGGMGSAWDLAFADHGETAIVADGGNEAVHLLRRADARPIRDIDPRRCGLPGFRWVHALAIDSAGHLYTGEVTGRRILRFSVEP